MRSNWNSDIGARPLQSKYAATSHHWRKPQGIHSPSDASLYTLLPLASQPYTAGVLLAATPGVAISIKHLSRPAEARAPVPVTLLGAFCVRVTCWVYVSVLRKSRYCAWLISYFIHQSAFIVGKGSRDPSGFDFWIVSLL